MTQNDLSIANADGATVRADLNGALQALASQSSGATAPTTIYPNQWWFDTTTNILKQRDNANTAWVNAFSKSGTTWIPYRNGTQLGDAAEKTIGTSGATVPLLNALNTWGAVQTFAAAIDESEGTAVASAATTNIWVTDGNTVHVTGTTTITSFGTAPRAGAWRKVIFDGILTLTDGADLNLPGSANIVTAADDFAFVYAETTTLFKVLYFRADGTSIAGGGITLRAEQAATGTAIDFLTIPAGAKRITISLENVSLSGSDNLLIQIGDAGGFETTGYASAGESAATLVTSTAGYIARMADATRQFSGHFVLTLSDDPNNTWVCSHVGAKPAGGVSYKGGGHKSLSGVLTQVRVTRTGSNTFDSGAIAALIES